MAFDAQAIFASLAEKERIKGHHSPEGKAIRTLSCALTGWSAGALAVSDVIVLCDQALEDWLNTCLGGSRWSTRTLDALVPRAVAEQLITRTEAEGLLWLHRARVDGLHALDAEVFAALEFSVDLIDKRW